MCRRPAAGPCQAVRGLGQDAKKTWRRFARSWKAVCPRSWSLRKHYQRQLQAVAVPEGGQADLAQRAQLDRGEGLQPDRRAAWRSFARSSGAGPRSLLQCAEVPAGPVERFPFKQIARAALAGLLLPFVAVVRWDHGMRRVDNPACLQDHCQCTLLAEVPRVPVRLLSAGPPGPSGPKQEMLEESADNLSTSLRLAELRSRDSRAGRDQCRVRGREVECRGAIGRQPRPDPGRDRVADRWRHAIARRTPSVPRGPGSRTGDGLGGGCQPEEAIVPTSNLRLHVLPAGRLDANPHKLLTTPKLRFDPGQSVREVPLHRPRHAARVAGERSSHARQSGRRRLVVYDAGRESRPPGGTGAPADGKRGDSGGGSRAQRHTTWHYAYRYGSYPACA